MKRPLSAETAEGLLGLAEMLLCGERGVGAVATERTERDETEGAMEAE